MKKSIVFIFILGVMFCSCSQSWAGRAKFEGEVEVLKAREIKLEGEWGEFFRKLVEEGRMTLSDSRYYLVGWVRLLELPQTMITQIPSCRVRIWGKQIRIDYTIYGISKDKQYFIFPLGTKDDRSIKFRFD